MLLKVYCKSSRAPFNIRESAYSRPNLRDDIGEYFVKTCVHCKSSNEYHVNDVTAHTNHKLRRTTSLGAILLIVITTLFFWNKGVITNVGLIIGALILAASNIDTSTKSFNSYRINATPKH